MRVAIRTDASLAIGTGHVSRCLALAEALRRRGGAVVFLCRDLPGHRIETIAEAGFPVLRLPPAASGAAAPDPAATPPHAGWLGVPWQRDAEECIAALGATAPPDWLVVDHYALDIRWEERLAPHAGRLLVIDDLADRAHAGALLLDQNHRAGAAESYRGLVPPGCRLLLGPRHALLRPDFAALRDRRPDRDGRIRRVLVFLGGVDRPNLTARAVRALLALERDDLTVDIVIGAGNPHRAALEALVADAPGCRLLTGPQPMADLLARADFAIGAGGVSLWERAALGVPSLALGIADNQRAILRHMAAEGCLLGFPDGETVSVETLTAALRTLLAAPELVRLLSARSAALGDGRGDERVAARLMVPVVTVRPATPDDAERLWHWRNHPEVRRVSHTADPIPWEAHRAWVARTLADPDRLLLIGACGAIPCGTVRFDCALDGTATVSIHLAPDQRGRGLGGPLLEAAEAALADRHPEIRRLVAAVRPGNPASDRLFGEAGYRPDHLVFAKPLELDR